MTELYIPKPGERVRVTEVAPFDLRPEHAVGQETEVYSGTGPAVTQPGWLILNNGTYCRVEPVEKSEPVTCARCNNPCDPGDLYTDGYRVLCSGACQTGEQPKPERRFCACGQELFGWKSAVWCGDCHAHLENPRLTGDDLDRRIRDAQPEVIECAFDRPGYSWP